MTNSHQTRTPYRRCLYALYAVNKWKSKSTFMNYHGCNSRNNLRQQNKALTLKFVGVPIIDRSILRLRCKIKNKMAKNQLECNICITLVQTCSEQCSFIPVEAVPWHNKENTPITRSFCSPESSWSTLEQNAVFLIWILAAKSWRTPQNTRFATVRASSSVPFPHFHEGAVVKLSMMGTGSHMKRSFPLCICYCWALDKTFLTPPTNRICFITFTLKGATREQHDKFNHSST